MIGWIILYFTIGWAAYTFTRNTGDLLGSILWSMFWPFFLVVFALNRR